MFSLHTIIASSDLDKKAVFVMVSSNFKLESVISHETSEQHLRSVGKQSAKENLTVNSAAAKIVQSLNKNVFNRMTNLFRNVHALIKKRRPFTDFIWMCELDEIKGVDIGETYRNEKQVVNSAHYITFYLK
jgi:predicted DCC family thiol-disulfide oxidoreductase YuxK